MNKEELKKIITKDLEIMGESSVVDDPASDYKSYQSLLSLADKIAEDIYNYLNNNLEK